MRTISFANKMGYTTINDNEWKRYGVTTVSCWRSFDLPERKGDVYDYYIAGNEDTDLFGKIFLVDDIVEEICKPDK